MGTSSDPRDVAVGDDVYSADGHKIGTVAEVYPDSIEVKKGLFFPTDYVIPRSAIASAANGQIFLNVARDAASRVGRTAGSGDVTADATPVALKADDEICVDDAPTALGVRREEMAVGDEMRIPVFEEELTATVRPVEVGAIRIEKRIVSEGRVQTVPVTEDEIRVERRIINRPTHGTDSRAFAQIIIEVPLEQEMVVAETEGHLSEEIVVAKEVIHRTERVTDTVRREEISIEGGDA